MALSSAGGECVGMTVRLCAVLGEEERESVESVKRRYHFVSIMDNADGIISSRG